MGNVKKPYINLAQAILLEVFRWKVNGPMRPNFYSPKDVLRYFDALGNQQLRRERIMALEAVITRVF